MLDALRGYLGARLGLPPGALTFAEVAEVLRRKGVSEQLITEMHLLFEQFEAGRYAGGFHSADDPAK